MQARIQAAPPPKKLKIKKKVIRVNFKLFHLYFATFLVGNIIFSALAPLEKLKAKKSLFRFSPHFNFSFWVKFESFLLIFNDFHEKYILKVTNP